MSKGALLVLLTALSVAQDQRDLRIEPVSRPGLGAITVRPQRRRAVLHVSAEQGGRRHSGRPHPSYTGGRNRDPGRRFRQGYSAVQSRAIGEVRRKRVRSRLHRRGACPRRPLAYAVPAGPDSREMRLRASLKVQTAGLDTGLRRGQISVGMHHFPPTNLVRKKAGSGRYPPTARSESIRQP